MNYHTVNDDSGYSCLTAYAGHHNWRNSVQGRQGRTVGYSVGMQDVYAGIFGSAGFNVKNGWLFLCGEELGKGCSGYLLS